MNIIQFHRITTSVSKKSFFEGGDLPGIVYALTDDKLVYFSRQFTNDAEKQDVFNIYSTLLAILNAKFYSFASEMWFAPETQTPFLKPSQQSNRKEGILIVTEDRFDNEEFTMLEILRNPAGNQLVDAFPEGKSDYFGNNIKLFERVKAHKAPPGFIQAAIDHFNKLPKPSWYHEIDLKELDIE